MGVTTIGSGGKQEKVWQGTCETAHAVQAKVVNVGEGFELKEGVRIFIHFKKSNSVDNPTLNVNGTGAVEICNLDAGTVRAGAWKSDSYLYLTYVSYDNGTEVFPSWLIDNYTQGDAIMLGSVRLLDGPDATLNTSKGTAVTPKALQTVKDIADAALPKAGGTMTGNLTIDVTESQANTSFIAVDYGDYVAEMTVNESKASLGLFGNVNGSAEMNATSNTSNVTLSGNSSSLFLYGDSSVDGNGSSLLSIRNQTGNRRIYGLSPLGEGANDSHAAPKSYVDRMANFYAVECGGADGKTYKRWGKGDNDTIYFDVSQPWYFEINQNRVLEVKITVTFDCTDYMSGIQVYGAKKSGSTVDFPLLMDIKAGNAVANRPTTYTGTVCASVNSYVGATQGDGYGIIYASLYGDATKITNAKIMVETITIHPFDW